MRYLSISAVVVLVLFLGIPYFFPPEAKADHLKEVQKLTDAEITKLQSVRNEVVMAQDKLKKLEAEIATAHNIKAESWMEWSTYWEIKDQYILFYGSSHMDLPSGIQ